MILLDTHVWIWWVANSHDMLPDEVLERISDPSENPAIASVSCLEVSLLVKKQRLQLECGLEEWFRLALEEAGITVVSLTATIAARVAALPDINPPLKGEENEPLPLLGGD